MEDLKRILTDVGTWLKLRFFWALIGGETLKSCQYPLI
jgi:hypothetical protein